MLARFDPTVDNAEAPVNIDPSVETDPVEVSKKSKKKKKKESKKPGTNDTSDMEDTVVNTSQLKAVVLEMSHFAPSNEATTPLYQFAGTDTGSTASGDTVTSSQECEQANPSPQGKVKPPRRLRSDNHLVQASPPNRRISSRVKHSVKKSSDSSDSTLEATPSCGTAVAPKVPRTLAEMRKLRNVCNSITLPVGHTFLGAGMRETDDEQGGQMLYIIVIEPDSVEAMKLRMQSMDQQERNIKEKKRLVMEAGRVLGEIDDEVEDNGVRVAEVVESME